MYVYAHLAGEQVDLDGYDGDEGVGADAGAGAGVDVDANVDADADADADYGGDAAVADCEIKAQVTSLTSLHNDQQHAGVSMLAILMSSSRALVLLAQVIPRDTCNAKYIERQLNRVNRCT